MSINRAHNVMLDAASRLTGRPVTNSALSQHKLMIALLLEGIDSGNLSAEVLERARGMAG